MLVMTHIIGCIRAEEQHIEFHVGPTDTRDVPDLGDVATNTTSTNDPASGGTGNCRGAAQMSPPATPTNVT